MSPLADRVQATRLALASAAPGTSPRILAVTKTLPIGVVHEALDAGLTDLGENYAQELRDKAPLAPRAVWHFIGRLQRNKARYVARAATWVHALDHVDQAEALAAERLGPPLRVLIAVHQGPADNKGGVDRSDLPALARRVMALPQLDLCGLFGMPPATDDPETSAPWFAELADLAAEGRRDGLPLHELSMGTSQDHLVAARLGATWVRLGTSLFGPRHPKT